MMGFCKHGNERPGSIKHEEFLNHQNDCGLDAFAHLECCVAQVGGYLTTFCDNMPVRPARAKQYEKTVDF